MLLVVAIFVTEVTLLTSVIYFNRLTNIFKTKNLQNLPMICINVNAVICTDWHNSRVALGAVLLSHGNINTKLPLF